MTIRKKQKIINEIKEKVLNNIRSFGFSVEKNGEFGKTFYSIDNNSLIPESNATILAQNAKNVKLDSYEKLQKIKSGRAGRNQQDARSKLLFK